MGKTRRCLGEEENIKEEEEEEGWVAPHPRSYPNYIQYIHTVQTGVYRLNYPLKLLQFVESV